jgi:prepilin-type processing-associated H-X9-DG protein
MVVESYKGNYDSYFPPAMTADNNLRWHGARRHATDPWDHTRGPLYPYLQDGEIHTCPSFSVLSGGAKLTYELGAGGYGYNEQYVGGSPTNPPKMYCPAKDPLIHDQCGTILFGDAAALDPTTKELIEYGFVEAPFYEAWGTKSDPSCHFRHRGRANFVFCDGHVAAMDKDRYIDVSGWTAITVMDCIRIDLGYPCSDNRLFDRW